MNNPCDPTSNFFRKWLALACGVFLSTAFPNRAGAAEFLVTTTADSGAGSLRQAILDANASPGADKIHFNISGVGPHVIQRLLVSSVRDRRKVISNEELSNIKF